MPLTLPVVTYDPTKTIITRKTFVTFTPTVGIPQVATARALGTVTGSGNATATITGSGITNSPVAVSVAVAVCGPATGDPPENETVGGVV